jgi:hypothetical protein
MHSKSNVENTKPDENVIEMQWYAENHTTSYLSYIVFACWCIHGQRLPLLRPLMPSLELKGELCSNEGVEIVRSMVGKLDA